MTWILLIYDTVKEVLEKHWLCMRMMRSLRMRRTCSTNGGWLYRRLLTTAVSLSNLDYPVGLESRVLQVNSLLKDRSDDGVVHMVGIHGIGGIGKSTVARAVYNSISDQFEGFCCFLENVRENSCKHGLVHLQETVLSEILGDKEIRLGNVWNGMSIIQQRLSGRKVLLVLDDIDKIEQLQAIAGAPNWFGLGSRVIITTRDYGLLKQHDVKSTYKVEELNDKEARELLYWNAFKTDKVDSRYATILNRAVGYASRLPLALEVIGSNLFGKGEEECKRTLDRYDRFPDKKIKDILKVSYNSLEEDEGNVFLDIACFFNGHKLADVEDILSAHYSVSVKYSIEELIDKSLIKIDGGLVTLHYLIQDMGRDIVREESPHEPGKRSRLWFCEDIVQVLSKNKGTSEIHILILDFPKDEAHLKGPKGEEINWDGEAFNKMNNLRTLIIRNGSFSKGPIHLPNRLRVLKWQGYPLPSLPCYFHPKKLSILELLDSCLKPCEPMQAFSHLRILDFSNSESVTEIPDVSGVQNLEKLSFRHCENLTKVHDSVGRLGNLVILDASGCKNLKTFPPIILTSLEQLNLSHCSILESFPEILGKMEKVTELLIRGSPIKEYPFSILNLTQLRKLELQLCGMVQLPRSIFMLPELSMMHVSSCEGLTLSEQDKGKVVVPKSSNVDHLVLSYCNISNDFLPIGLNFFFNVKDLNLSGNNFITLHAWIKECHLLRNLKMDDCRRLQEIRGIPRKLEKISVKGCTALRCLDLTVLPECTAECCFLKELILDDCGCLREIKGLPPNLDSFSAKGCTALSSQSISMLFKQEWVEAGNKKCFFPGKKIPEWFTHRTRGMSMYFWFRNKFPPIFLCLVIGRGDKKDIKVKFSPRVSVNGNKWSLGCHKVYEFMIETDHVLLLKFEDNEDLVFSDKEWNQVEVSYADHITNNEDSIRQVASYCGIHVLYEQTCSPWDVQFHPPQTMINVNLDSYSMETPQQRVKNDQTFVLSSPVLTLTQPPPTDAEKVLVPQSILPIKRPLEDVRGDTSKCFREDEEVYAITIQNNPPFIERLHEACDDDDDVQLESASSCELQSADSSFNTNGFDSDDPSNCVGRKLSISGVEAISQVSSSNTEVSHSDYPINLVDRKISVNGHATIISEAASLGSIREAINALELLMVKDLSEFSSDHATQSGLHQLLDVLSRRTIEVQEAIGEFKRKAVESCREFQSTVKSMNKLKNYEMRLNRIKQETATSNGRQNELKNSIKNISLAIKDESRRKKELEEEIATLKEQLDTKGRDLDQIVLNLKNKETTLSTYSTNCASLNEQAQKLLEEAEGLLGASSEIKDEGEAAEVKQNSLKSTWSTDITKQLSKIKHNVLGLYE
ncbi:TMV resistance protein N-like isoform X2 [Cicer arietinum]|uniref:TMV resistance protein N-like isoform X3 n=1 Tax=Cicer arietinum TaxID=3827 RepID=A0A3Q7YB46_CICAR|nr:TMV resistance protein N-like isoform X3 [Cicer arietinum]